MKLLFILYTLYKRQSQMIQCHIPASTKTSVPISICLEDTLHNNFKMRVNSA
jgi:hypothetical protein